MRWSRLRCTRAVAGCVLLAAATAAAQDAAPPPPKRTLLYPANVNAVAAPLRPFVTRLLAARAEQGRSKPQI